MVKFALLTIKPKYRLNHRLNFLLLLSILIPKLFGHGKGKNFGT